jgi:hypothetical protein
MRTTLESTFGGGRKLFLPTCANSRTLKNRSKAVHSIFLKFDMRTLNNRTLNIRGQLKKADCCRGWYTVARPIIRSEKRIIRSVDVFYPKGIIFAVSVKRYPENVGNILFSEFRII